MVQMFLLVAAGCFGGSPSLEKWPKQAAKANCDFSKRCATAFFYASFDNTRDCRADVEATLEEEAEAAEDQACEFDEDEAKDCIKALEESCRSAGEAGEDAFEACTMVWDCGNRDLQITDPTDTGT